VTALLGVAIAALDVAVAALGVAVAPETGLVAADPLVIPDCDVVVGAVETRDSGAGSEDFPAMVTP
jgi:hypothetical protein